MNTTTYIVLDSPTDTADGRVKWSAAKLTFGQM
jgi:hypothetical protein